MAILVMAVYDTPENKRWPLTLRTLDSLARTVDCSRHRLVVVDNGSTCPGARTMLDRLGEYTAFAVWQAEGVRHAIPPHRLIRNPENRGQARALNQGWALRRPNEHVARVDNDVEILDAGWLDRLEDCLDRDPTLGLVGLKRPDLWERPDHPEEAWRSELRMLPHEPGQDWLVVERAASVIGTCQAVSRRLVDRIGYLYQGSFRWGLEDADYHARATAAGFWCGFYPHVRIRHLDETPPGGSEYQRWKERQGGEHHPEFNARREAYRSGSLDLYHGPDDE